MHYNKRKRSKDLSDMFFEVYTIYLSFKTLLKSIKQSVWMEDYSSVVGPVSLVSKASSKELLYV